MTSRFVFRPKKYSAGLALICDHLKNKGNKVVLAKPQGSRYRTKARDVEIPWGGELGNKLIQLNKFRESEVPCVQFTQDTEEASSWLNAGDRVVCRRILDGHGGAGIILASPGDFLPVVPLYTKYQKKKREFRVHIVLSEKQNEYAALISEKKKMAENRRPENFNPYIRNHANGWVFCHNTEIDEDLTEQLKVISLNAINALGYNFGAVDIGYHPNKGCFVFEVNSMPGCNNNTANWYADVIELFYGVQ